MIDNYCPKCGSYNLTPRIFAGTTGRVHRKCNHCGVAWSYPAKSTVQEQSAQITSVTPTHRTTCNTDTKLNEKPNFFARQKRWQRGILIAAFLVFIWTVPLLALVNLSDEYHSDFYVFLSLAVFYLVDIPLTIFVCVKSAKYSKKYRRTFENNQKSNVSRGVGIFLYLLAGVILFAFAPLAELAILMLLPLEPQWSVCLWFACVSMDLFLFFCFTKLVRLPNEQKADFINHTSTPQKKQNIFCKDVHEKTTYHQNAQGVKRRYQASSKANTQKPAKMSKSLRVFLVVVTSIVWFGGILTACILFPTVGGIIIFVAVVLLIFGRLDILLVIGGILPFIVYGLTSEEQTTERMVLPGYSEYMTGEEYEVFVGKCLQAKGYRVSLTKTTGDFGADLIAVAQDGTRISIQCKKYRSPVGISAVQQVYSSMTHYNCTKSAVITNSTFTTAARRSARENNVMLFERFK